MPDHPKAHKRKHLSEDAFTNPMKDTAQTSSHRAYKRAKMIDARAIAAQSSSSILRNGELNVDKFVAAREYEIRALQDGLRRSKKASSTRAFQDIPRSLRRRTASHNVQRVPKRLKARATREMKEDNTPRVTARRRTPTPKIRLRRDTVKKLQKLSVRRESQRGKKRSNLTNGTEKAETQKATGITTRFPKLKKNTLSAPPKPEARFKKRQVHKTWLPTHIWHSKRAKMTEPKAPLWRFAVPLNPTEKTYRPTHRAIGARGAIAWDTSYYSTIGLQGSEESLISLLKMLHFDRNSDDRSCWGKAGHKWITGTRSWEGWLYESSRSPTNPIAPAIIVWCAVEKSGELPYDEQAAVTYSTIHEKKPKRQIIVRLHPSSFLQLWEHILLAAKKQHPPVMVEDLRFEIGSIEIAGPGSTEALRGVLEPSSVDNDPSTFDSPQSLWKALGDITNPAALPPNAFLGFTVSDPRLRHPPRIHSKSSDTKTVCSKDVLQILSCWPLDTVPRAPAFFSRSRRLAAVRSMPSQKAINRRKSLAEPGNFPAVLPSDPAIPILLLASRATGSTSSQGKWTLLLPWKCVQPLWYCLMHFPLSASSSVRFGGLNNLRQVAFEQGMPWFPADFPGTKAGWEWELMERDKRKAEWESKPKGKRIEWTSIDLGMERKGEVGTGWACDWERILLAPESACYQQRATCLPVDSSIPDNGMQTEKVGDCQSRKLSPPPPFGIYHLVCSLSSSTSEDNVLSPAGLACIRFKLLSRGAPTPCARIYRLPLANEKLRGQWTALSMGFSHSTRPDCRKASVQRNNPGQRKSGENDPETPPNIAVQRQLAASLLPEESSAEIERQSRAGHKDYPEVPDEVDLVGFVTSGAFNLAGGRGTGIGSVFLKKMIEGHRKRKSLETKLCVIRNAGTGLGRLAIWELV